MINWLNRIDQRLMPYKKRFYLNLLLRGSLLTGALLISYFIIAVFSEYFFWLNRTGRFFLLFSFIGLASFCFWKFLIVPFRWFLLRKGMNNEDAARRIGQSIPLVNDRLINLLQLSQHSDSVLAAAAVEQRFKELEPVSFERSVNLAVNKKLLPYFIIPVLIVIGAAVFNFSMVSDSTTRIIRFNDEFVPTAPFQFEISSSPLQAYYGEDFVLRITLSGQAIPETVSLEHNGLIHPLIKKNNEFIYTFEKVQSSQTFRLYGAGFYSLPYTLEVISRPELTGLITYLSFPSYLNLKDQRLTNSGNLGIPEGTRVRWMISALNASKATITFSDGTPHLMQEADQEMFSFNKGFRQDDRYVLGLENDQAKNRDKMEYGIRVIKDAYPEISIRQAGDSVLYKDLYLGGLISDDHGLTKLELSWQVIRKNSEAGVFINKSIQIEAGLNKQEFVYPWSLDSLNLQAEDQLNYFLTVWDNDGVNGKKAAKTGVYTFRVPGASELQERLRQSEEKTASDLESGFEKAKKLSETIGEAQKKLRGKQNLEWEDKAMIEDILRQKQEMDRALEELKKEHEKLNEQRNAFDEQDERIREKTEQLQKLMEEVLDEETKKLFRELEKLLKENSNADQMQKMLDKIRRNEINVEKELDRIRELFNQLKMEARIEEAIGKMEQHIRDQEKLLKNTLEQEKANEQQSKNKSENNTNEQNKKQEDLARQQEGIKENLNDDQKMMEEIKKLAEEAGEEEPEVPEKEDFKEVSDEMEKSEEQLKGGENKKSSESQKKSIQKMNEMKNKMEQMQSSMEMELDEANMELLRQILHGVLKLSFDQEKNMKAFNNVQLSDPAYLILSQQQLKLQDDSKVLEDSLLALGKKDAALGSFVTREIGELNHHLDRATENIRERRKPNASAEMQLSMTSMNNLALMLNDHFQQMMNMMSKSGKGKKKSKDGKKPSLSEMQKQLNDQIEQLKNGGKSGRELSEELARMAAEQERIRKALQNLQEKLDEQNGQKSGGDLPGKMEQTEMDLVNKRITEQTIRRQKEILTRLLETEKSMREQEFDQERKGEAAKDLEKEIPKAFQEYLKQKEKEVEMLKTVPPKLYPYFKKEASDYFQRLGQHREMP